MARGSTRTSDSSPPPDADPVGDADLLADLGVPATRLLTLCAHEGMLPSDITAELCTRSAAATRWKSCARRERGHLVAQPRR